MAFGVTAPGPQNGSCRHGYNESEGCGKTLDQYLEQIRAVIRQDVVDIMLLSASNLERLAIQEKLSMDFVITPAARADDTSDVWAVRGANTRRIIPRGLSERLRLSISSMGVSRKIV